MRAKSIKAFLLVGLFVMISCQSSGQVLKFNTTQVTTCEKLSDGSWGPWADAVEVTQAVVVNFDKAVITVASSPKQVYDIVEAEDQIQDANGDDFFTFICEDDDGDACRVVLSVMHSQGGRPLLTVEYDDVMLLYAMTEAE